MGMTLSLCILNLGRGHDLLTEIGTQVPGSTQIYLASTQHCCKLTFHIG
jgi:hypothetical protein